MSKKIVDNAKQILKGVQFDFEITFDWANSYYEPYYEYFSHPDVEIRKYALLIFVGGLGNWRLGSAHIFTPVEQRNPSDTFDKDKVYHFEDYIRSFLQYRDSIKQEFPLLYSRIVWYLLWLDNEKSLESIFTLMDRRLINELKQLLSASGIDASKFQNNFIDIIKEIGLTSY